MTRTIIIKISAAAAFMAIGALLAFGFLSHRGGPDSEYSRHHNAHHRAEHMGSAGAGHEHDEINMPGLNGRDTTQQEVDDLKRLFRQHEAIERQVSLLPNGIRTITASQSDVVRDAIISHVTMMVTRLQEGRNPEVMIQSPTLDAIFKVYDQIDTEIELTDTGIAVIQTSDNPDVVSLLQTHAAEVSDMSDRGMVAVHERMTSHGH